MQKVVQCKNLITAFAVPNAEIRFLFEKELLTFVSNMKHFNIYFVGVRLATKVIENSCHSYSCVSVNKHNALKWSCVTEDIVWLSVKLEESVYRWRLYNQSLCLISTNLARFHLLQSHLDFYSVKISCPISSADKSPMAFMEQ